MMNELKNYNGKTIVKEIAIGFLLTAMYVVLEPLLSQMYLLHGYSIINIPYEFLKKVLPFFIFAVFIFHMFKEKGHVRFGVLLPVLIIFFGYFISTAINGKNLSIWYETALPIVALSVFIMPVCSKKEYLRPFVAITAYAYIGMAALNLFCQARPLIYWAHTSWYQESFLGGIENMCAFPLLMGAFFALLDSHVNNNKLAVTAYLAIYFLSTYRMWTAAAVVCAVNLLIYLIPPVRRFADRIDLLWYVGASALIFVIFMWCWKPLMNWYPVKFLMENVLKKDVTLTGRVDIWQGVLKMFYEKPVLGHGLMNNPQELYFDTGYNNMNVHAHNAFLQTLYEGGIFTLLSVFALLTYTAVKIRKCSDKGLTGIFKIFIFLFMLNLQVDQFMMYPWRSGCWCMICFLCSFAVMVSENEC